MTCICVTTGGHDGEASAPKANRFLVFTHKFKKQPKIELGKVLYKVDSKEDENGFDRMGWLHKLKDESAQVAVIFALSIIPVFAVAGFAIDFQNTIKKKQKVQLVIDSAVLAAHILAPLDSPLVVFFVGDVAFGALVIKFLSR